MAKDAAKKKDEEAEEKDEKSAKDEAEEGEEGASEGEGEGGKPKKSKKKLIIIVAVIIVVLAGAGAGAYFTGLIGPHESKVSDAGADKSAEKATYYTLPEFLANLNTSAKQVSYLKTTIVLELAKPTDAQVVEANLPKVYDTFNIYLRELRASDLAGSAGMQRLREELMTRANQVLAPTKINDVLFKEIIVQ